MHGVRVTAAVAMALASLALAACTVVPGGTAFLSCHGSQRPQQIAELYFGRRIGTQGMVSEAAWRRFVDREVTPRFPAGLTIIDARGQWRGTGGIVREPSKVVVVALAPEQSDNHARIEAIVAAYKTAFHQDGVGVFVRTDCVSFMTD